jgi:hypothetical protein
MIMIPKEASFGRLGWREGEQSKTEFPPPILGKITSMGWVLETQLWAVMRWRQGFG